jgi:hypothetical protein
MYFIIFVYFIFDVLDIKQEVLMTNCLYSLKNGRTLYKILDINLTLLRLIKFIKERNRQIEIHEFRKKIMNLLFYLFD